MYYRRDHTFDVKTCLEQNRYVFDVIVTLFVSSISWSFARDISTVFEDIKHDAGLHAVSFSLGFNVHKLYLK
jgi:4-hydroxybenzoate polyprenyltransferase